MRVNDRTAEKMVMRVYSGECEMGVCGTPTDMRTTDGDRLFVGDIVVSASKDQFGISYFCGLTVIVEDRPKLYGRTEQEDSFVMGLKSVDVNTDTGWYIKRVKSWQDCIDGEHWAAYGFNYRSDAT